MDKLHSELKNIITSSGFDDSDLKNKKMYDPEMLYVECRKCGRPVLWEPGRTTALLMQSNVSPLTIDDQCLILSDGCRECMPERDGFSMSIVRLASVSTPDLAMLQKPVGNA